MTSLNSYSALSWEDQLDRQFEFLQFCLSSNNIELLHSLVTQNVTDNRDHVSVMYNNDVADNGSRNFAPSVQQKLAQIGIHYVKNLSQTFIDEMGIFEQKVESDSARQDLDEALHNLEDALKENSVRVLRESKNRGKDVIQKLGSRARHSAASLFQTIMSIAAQVLASQQSVIGAVRDALHGSQDIHAVIDNAYDTNKNATEVTVNYIMRIGSYQVRADESHRADHGLEDLGDGDLRRLSKLGTDYIDDLSDTFQKQITEAERKVKAGEDSKSALAGFDRFIGQKIFRAETDLEKKGGNIISEMPQQHRFTARNVLAGILRCFTLSFHQQVSKWSAILSPNGDFKGAVDAIDNAAREAKKEIEMQVRREKPGDKKDTKGGYFSIYRTDNGWKVRQVVQ